MDAAGNQFLASKFAGSGATLLVSAVGYNNSTLTFAQTVDASGNATTTSGAGVSALGFQSDKINLLAEAVYPGTGYNLSGLRDGSTQGVSVEINNLSVEDKLSVNSEGAQVEQFQVVLSPSAANSVEFLLVNDELNNKSDYVYADVITTAGAAYTGIPDQFGEKLSVATSFNGELVADTATPRFVKPVAGTYSLAGGKSGYGVTEEDGSGDRTALIGAAATKTGIYALDDDSLNISIAAIPGISDQDVQNALITLGRKFKELLST